MKRTRPPQYRHELKYFINQGEYTLLSGRLQKTMAADAYAKNNGGEYFLFPVRLFWRREPLP